MGKRKRKVKSIKKKKNNKIFSSLKKKKKMRGGGPPINMKTLQKLQGKFEMEDIPFDIQQYIKDPLSLQQPQVSSQVSSQVRPQVSSQQEVSNSNDKTKSSECISSPQSLGGNCNEDLTHIIDNICIKILNREDGPYLQYTFPLSHINKGTSDTFDFHNFLGEWTKNEKVNAVIEEVIQKYNKHNPVTVDTVTSPDPLKVGVPSQGASAGGGGGGGGGEEGEGEEGEGEGALQQTDDEESINESLSSVGATHHDAAGDEDEAKSEGKGEAKSGGKGKGEGVAVPPPAATTGPAGPSTQKELVNQ